MASAVKVQLIIITGMSGAGKSQALHRLEDAGYFCADNLPFNLIPGLVEQCRSAKPPVAQAAVVIDSREAVFGTDWESMLERLDKLDVEKKIIFLDCSDEVLLRRFVETRRRHPLASAGDISLGIARERALLQALRERAVAVIDTSSFKPRDLAARLAEALSLDSVGTLMLSIMSFGYKRGLPMDADLVVDMRFLPNPFYDVALRPLSGKDAAVADFLTQNSETQVFFDGIESLLRRMLPGYLEQGKLQVSIAFGCTGGRHRSVFAAEELHRRLASSYAVRCTHRDLGMEAADIQARFAPEGGRP